MLFCLFSVKCILGGVGGCVVLRLCLCCAAFVFVVLRLCLCRVAFVFLLHVHRVALHCIDIYIVLL